jgi:hypothetical protein
MRLLHVFVNAFVVWLIVAWLSLCSIYRVLIMLLLLCSKMQLHLNSIQKWRPWAVAVAVAVAIDHGAPCRLLLLRVYVYASVVWLIVAWLLLRSIDRVTMPFVVVVIVVVVVVVVAVLQTC